MPRAKTYPATPLVLVWARERLGLSVVEAAELLKVDAAELVDVEQGIAEPRVALLEAMTKKYHVSYASLLSPTPPHDLKPPQDFRTVGGASPRLSADTLVVIEQVQFERELIGEVIELLADGGEQLVIENSLPFISLGSRVDEVAYQERDRLSITDQTQLSWSGADEAFRHWRAAIEGIAGVLVFARNMPRDDCRGFSLGSDGYEPTIVVNGYESDQAKLFTLLHEYCHLLLRETGICNERDDGDLRRFERYCNQFAAFALMPTALTREVAASVVPRGTEWTPDAVTRVARRLRVGRPAALIRLAEIGLIPSDNVELFLGQWEADTWERRSGSGPAPIPVSLRALNRLGVRYSSAILHALETGAIDVISASEILNVRPRHFEDMRQRIERREELYAT